MTGRLGSSRDEEGGVWRARQGVRSPGRPGDAGPDGGPPEAAKPRDRAGTPPQGCVCGRLLATGVRSVENARKCRLGGHMPPLRCCDVSWGTDGPSGHTRPCRRRSCWFCELWEPRPPQTGLRWLGPGAGSRPRRPLFPGPTPRGHCPRPAPIRAAACRPFALFLGSPAIPSEQPPLQASGVGCCCLRPRLVGQAGPALGGQLHRSPGDAAREAAEPRGDALSQLWRPRVTTDGSQGWGPSAPRG